MPRYSLVIIAAISCLSLVTSSCHSKKATDNNTVQQAAPQSNTGKDTIKANLAAGDKNTQILENGIVMVVTNSIIENLDNAKEYSDFVGLTEKTDLYKLLTQKGPFTVFAPSNDAFSKLDQRSVDRLKTDTGKGKLEKVLKYQIIAGLLRSRDLTAGETISTIEGEPLVVIIEDGKTKLMDSEGIIVDVTKPDILCKNGIVHFTDGVLMPKGINLH